ncbi:MAG TPA: FlgD immunoglobulin-like domain containing protein [Candidatus Krumholzibacteria bacterium]|nr:FlgD immunoglobulin-like domain containing protein [Candidatus Krumholzibacteria bacterium]HRX51216.1 FlgD immunoglobulin-like domain containing protein [Candidatus Krumholzibacteria bacterium]
MTFGRLARPILTAVAALLLASWAGAQTVDVTLSWAAPADGAPVDHYVVYWSIDGADFRKVVESEQTAVVIPCEAGSTYLFRVSGVSEYGLEGVVSETSDPVEILEGQQSEGAPPSAPALRPNYPNPFNPETTIRYGIPVTASAAAGARLEIYDMRGVCVRRLPVNATPGWHEVVWNGRDDLGQEQASGQYFVRLLTSSETSVWKMTMVK